MDKYLIYLPVGHDRLPSMSFYSITVVYLALHSYLLSLFCLFQDFTGVNKTTHTIPT